VFTDLLTDGIIAGVGGVLAFLPQILLLFLFISILEDSGYMARAAFLMDRLMRAVGLHGKAFVPLLSSFACAVPGIMATRTIENPKDRNATIMIAPFMSCSARLPVYTLMIAAFFSGRKVLGVISLGALIILGMYLLGITVAIIVAWILKHTILNAPPPPFVMELPPYRIPDLGNVAHALLTRTAVFIKRAGTVILSISILLWALVAFPRATIPPLPMGEGTGVRVLSAQAPTLSLPQEEGQPRYKIVLQAGSED
jgi:ferrous iron transport protein B